MRYAMPKPSWHGPKDRSACERHRLELTCGSREIRLLSAEDGNLKRKGPHDEREELRDEGMVDSLVARRTGSCGKYCCAATDAR